MITIDKEFEIPQYSKICTFCKHNDVGEDHKCEAFPKGIPMEKSRRNTIQSILRFITSLVKPLIHAEIIDPPEHKGGTLTI